MVSLLAPFCVSSAKTSGSNLSPASLRILASKRLARSALFSSNCLICCCSRIRSFSSSAPPSPDSASSFLFKCFGFLTFFFWFCCCWRPFLSAPPLPFCFPPNFFLTSWFGFIFLAGGGRGLSPVPLLALLDVSLGTVVSFFAPEPPPPAAADASACC